MVWPARPIATTSPTVSRLGDWAGEVAGCAARLVLVAALILLLTLFFTVRSARPFATMPPMVSRLGGWAGEAARRGAKLTLVEASGLLLASLLIVQHSAARPRRVTTMFLLTAAKFARPNHLILSRDAQQEAQARGGSSRRSNDVLPADCPAAARRSSFAHAAADALELLLVLV